MLDNYAPGTALRKDAPWNQNQQPEEAWEVQEWVPNADDPARVSGWWYGVDPSDYGTPADLDPSDLLAHLQRKMPDVRFRLVEVDRD